MALYKRGKIFYIKLTHPNGSTIRQSTRTSNRRKAQEIHDRLKARLWDEAHGRMPEVLWQEAVVRWLDERGHKKSIKDDLQKFRWLDQHLRNAPLASITRERIEQIVSQKQSTPATRNRYRALIRAVLRAAHREWGWLREPPTVRMEKEPPRRVRFLTRQEAERLIQHLPPHLAAMARFSMATGVRAGNMLRLRWDQVDLERRVAWFEETKNGHPLGVYLNREAVEVLRAQIGEHPDFVFTYRGRPIKQVSTRAWYQALRAAGIEDFRWHDWRHTWASWHVQHGTPLYALQEQGGWKSVQMVQRYAHLSAEHFSEYGERIAGTNLDPHKERGISPRS